MKETRDKYSNYCREHKEEFRNELRDEAARALGGWPCRIAGVILAISTLLTYIHPANQDNPHINYTLFAYAVPMLIATLFQPVSLLFSSITKYAPIILDLLLVFGLGGFLFTLWIVLGYASLSGDMQSVFIALLGQINFVLLLTTAFSYHISYSVTFARNMLFAWITAGAIAVINIEFLVINWIQIMQGFMTGTIFSWIFFVSIRTRFYLKSTDADMRQHLYNQFSKLVYPHQLERIKLGDELESTMPLKEGKAIINVFDVQKSSEIRHERTREFFMGVFQAFLQICMEGYEHNPLRSRAFRLKETGDGFISAVGYPFLPTEACSLADSAVGTALDMFQAFNGEVEKFNYSKPIKGAIGLAYNSAQGTFQSGGIRAYDLFGDSLIQAARYEELRKHPILSGIIKTEAESLGLDFYHILIIQEVIYNSLSESFRELFVEVDLWGEKFEGYNFHSLHDNDARYVYFHVVD